jgi:hypothetical protein
MDNEQYREVASALKTNFEVMTRLDERVKSLVDKLHESDEHTKVVFQRLGELTTRVGIVEARVWNPPCPQLVDLRTAFEKNVSHFLELQTLVSEIGTKLSHVERTATAVEDRWKKVFGFVFQALSTLLICYLLYKMNLSTPPLP